MKNWEIIYSGLSVRLLQESSIFEENVTLRQIPMWVRFSQQWLWRLVGCDIKQSGRSLQSFASAVLSSGQLCAIGSVMLESIFLLFPLGCSTFGYTGNITLCLGQEWTKLDYDGWTLGIVWKMHHYCWVHYNQLKLVWCLIEGTFCTVKNCMCCVAVTFCGAFYDNFTPLWVYFITFSINFYAPCQILLL
jgi:hypothetical protein